jgi:phosphoinositide-3-kinase regulatory subunit 4
VHSWDLRCAKEPFVLSSSPEIGYVTSLAVGNDRNWLCTGTNTGKWENNSIVFLFLRSLIF